MSTLLITQVICNGAAVAWVLFWLHRAEGKGES